MLSRPFILMLALATGAAGCLTAPAGELDLAADDLPMDVALPTTEEIAGEIMLSAATPVRTINYGGAFVNYVDLTDDVTGFVFELEWTPSSGASRSLSMWIRPAGVGNLPPDNLLDLVATSPPLARADGASPLRIALAASDFPEPGEYEIVVRAAAAPVGVAASQPFTLHVTTFAGLEFDAEYSALGEHDEH
ncbi:MAG TPA: hypothetical protein VM582_05725 [Candidatus Thermoplasmatota archaeon]|nr:hypothetical protein [Candidatus Thermoplasmatota archaeon]